MCNVINVTMECNVIYFLLFSESQVFQFWVRATDLGKPALHSDVPVEVYIMSPEDQAPIFERTGEKFFYPENSPPGTIYSFQLNKNKTFDFR